MVWQVGISATVDTARFDRGSRLEDRIEGTESLAKDFIGIKDLKNLSRPGHTTQTVQSSMPRQSPLPIPFTLAMLLDPFRTPRGMKNRT